MVRKKEVEWSELCRLPVSVHAKVCVVVMWWYQRLSYVEFLSMTVREHVLDTAAISRDQNLASGGINSFRILNHALDQ